MARGYKRKRYGRKYARGGSKRVTPKSTRRPRQYKKKYRPAIPRAIQPASYQRRQMAVSFDYSNQFVVDPQYLQGPGGTSYVNALQIITLNVNNLANIFSDHRPFAADPASPYPPVWCAPQSPVNAATPCPNFSRFGALYEEYAVIGAKVQYVFRPKNRSYAQHTAGTNPAFSADTTTTGQIDYPATTPTSTTGVSWQTDATRLLAWQTDVESMASGTGSVPGSVYSGGNLRDLQDRAGMVAGRFAHTNGRTDGKYLCQKWSSKKFFNYSDLKDNEQIWVGCNADGTPAAPQGDQRARLVVALQKEETSSPLAQTEQRYQNPYFVEMKVNWTVLFRNPRKTTLTNVPTAGTPGQGDMDVTHAG